MINEKIDWNKVRQDLDITLDAYESIINLEDFEELKALGNDIITVFRKHYFDYEKEMKKIEDNIGP